MSYVPTPVVVVLFCAVIAVGSGREALRPPLDVADVLKELSANQRESFGVHECNSLLGRPCTLDIQRDLHRANNSQPLYLIPGTDLFWLPNADGQLRIPSGSSIELHCTASFANSTNTAEGGNSLRLPKGTTTLKPSCVQDTTFQLAGKKFEFQQFACRKPVKFTVERTSRRCARNTSEIYRVGFNLTQSRFVETMRVCHDGEQVRTHYTQHTLLPANQHFERSVKRLNFSKAGYFGALDMNRIYTQREQRQQISTLLAGAHEQYFHGSGDFLARGHLAAKTDMIYGNQQRSTFTYFNAAPQWQPFNGGQWATLEDMVRKFIASAALEVVCLTGTWGTLELPLASGEYRQIYLTQDINGNGLVPVPMLFYRVLLDRRRPNAGIALIGVNNPYAKLTEIHDKYVICEDIRESVPWLRWIRNKSTKKGYLYACTVDAFASVVDHLPPHLVNVTEVLQ